MKIVSMKVISIKLKISLLNSKKWKLYKLKEIIINLPLTSKLVKL
jgi:hypothetical protein